VQSSYPPSSSLTSDAELIAAIVAGDPRAPGHLFGRYAPLVRTVLMRAMSRPADEVEDALQEVFLRLFRQIATIKDPAALRAFTLSIARRVAHSELRRKRLSQWQRLTKGGNLPEEGSVWPPAPTVTTTQLASALERVETRARKAFALRYFDGLELIDVAKELGCSLATAKRDLARAHASLEEVLDERLVRQYLERRRAA
jgi:RNA polymerase sigma-70 factor (ECF subfamily)